MSIAGVRRGAHGAFLAGPRTSTRRWAAAEDMGLPLTTTAAVGEELGFYPDLFGPDSAEAADIADLDSWRPGEEGPR